MNFDLMIDDEPQQAIGDELLSRGLMKETVNGLRFDSFAEEWHFESAITVGLEAWEMNLPDSPASQSEKAEVLAGIVPEQAELLCGQISVAQETEFTSDDLDDFMSNLTRTNCKEFAEGLGADSHPEPLGTFLKRLFELGERYQIA